MTTVTSRVQKLVTFSPQLYYHAEVKAKKLGVPFAEYLRHLVVKDVEEDIANLPMVDAETDQRIGKSLQDIEKGRYVDIDPSDEKELKKFFDIK
ncbi:hypothetical protein A3F03_02585 [Candidatus Roizmanbacteria bacterium RIFCSPHIGHO2_12_FULL_41_11]|uniref:Antitoxin n=2 Tax=Candidatus Roizmaniibacteriota TaxID=1752723 RepID=A0A1F7J6F0_9BACT|nr:MAG: hypothetical protein A3F03_02585 [Candidatus Roizmanbacteria bacterium RIFCSPHIGHO2_12_FULL_41_11]OGK51176.1 MAG: hypothetical protein A2966_00875 [Candidatus Roizmanbacteria bacterium RIFCSPLOWO2_01_FULL_41_22]